MYSEHGPVGHSRKKPNDFMGEITVPLSCNALTNIGYFIPLGSANNINGVAEISEFVSNECVDAHRRLRANSARHCLRPGARRIAGADPVSWSRNADTGFGWCRRLASRKRPAVVTAKPTAPALLCWHALCDQRWKDTLGHPGCAKTDQREHHNETQKSF